MMIGRIDRIPFLYKSVLKTQWLNGNMPTVKIGIYGGKLTPDNITLEHIVPHCKGGKTQLANLALATGANNYKRSAKPFSQYFNKDTFNRYIEQFRDIRLPEFDGQKYIEMLTKTVERVTR